MKETRKAYTDGRSGLGYPYLEVVVSQFVQGPSSPPRKTKNLSAKQWWSQAWWGALSKRAVQTRPSLKPPFL